MYDTTNFPIIFLHRTNIQSSQTIRHSSYDFIYVISGTIRILSSDVSAEYNASDICLIPADCAYTMEAAADNRILHMGLSPYFIEQHLGSYGTYVCNSVLEPNNNYTVLKQLITHIAAKYLEDLTFHQLSIVGLLFQLLDQLKKENAFLQPAEEKIPPKYNNRIHTIIRYIDDNYQSPLTLSSLSDALFLSPQYLSKFFKKYLHKNFKDYLLEKRLFHAHRDICYTSESITEIAIRHGFSDITAFSKAFRCYYQSTPSKYRKVKQSTMLLEEYDTFSTIKKEHSSELPFSADVLLDTRNTADVTKFQAFTNHYSALMNVGSVKNLLLETYQRQLLLANKQLHFQYLRMQGMISSAFIPQVLPRYDYYFLDTEKVLGFLFKHSFYPFIELIRLPYHTDTLTSASETAGITKSDRFYKLLEAFLCHCTAAYPMQWMSQWKFEVWKSPKETDEQYAADFLKIQCLIHQYLPEAFVGGSGFASQEDITQLQGLLDSLKKAQVVPDFFSANFSLLSGAAAAHPVFSTNKDILIKRAAAIRKIIRQFYPDIPFYITEWNSFFLPNTPIQYSCFQSAFICKTVLELNSYCNMMGYWLFCDTTFQQNPSKSETFQFWGRGLFGGDGIPMPSYYAFLILNRLGNKMISQGPDYCITQRGPDHYQILTFNYAHFSPSAVLGPDIGISFSETYKLFEPVPNIRMHFMLSSITPGTYRISRYLLDRAHGSILDLWIGGFAAGSVDEIEYLVQMKQPPNEKISHFYLQACIPEERTIYHKAEDSIHLDTTLLAHNVCFWDVVRQV